MAGTFDIVAKLRADATQFIAGLKSGEIATSSFATQVGGMQNVLAVGTAAAVGVAAVALFKLGASFHDAYKEIRVTTGATGESLANLEESFRNVFSKTPASMKDVSSTIADVNVKLGLTGKPLEDVSLQLIKLSRITGTDLKGNTEAVTTVFKNFGVAASDQKSKLDLLFRASQLSGVSVTDLATSMGKAGIQLRGAGIDFDHAAGFIATLAKAGVEVRDVLPAMTRSLATAAKAGKDSTTFFQETYNSIKDAATGADAAGIAYEAFGGKAGPKFAALIREGKLGYEEYTTALQQGSDTIGKAAGDVSTFGSKLSILGHNLQLAFEPLATAVFGAMNNAMKLLMPILQTGANILGDLVDAFLALPTPIQLIIPAFALLFTAVKGLAAMQTLIMLFSTSAITSFTELTAAVATWSFGFTAELTGSAATAAFVSDAIMASMGPIVIALGLAFVAFTVWNNGQKEAAKESKEFKDTLDKETGAWTDNTTALVENKLQKDGVLRSMNEAGITTVAWKNAVQDTHGPTKEMAQQLSVAEKALQNARYAGGDWMTNINEAKTAIQGSSGARADLITQLDNAGLLTEDLVNKLFTEAETYRKNQENITNVAIAQEMATGKTKDAATAAVEAARANKEEADSIKAKHDELRAAADPYFANLKAMKELKVAQDEYNVAVAQFGQNSPQADAAYGALTEAGGKYYDTLSALKEGMKNGSITADKLQEYLGNLAKLGIDPASESGKRFKADLEAAAAGMGLLDAPSVAAATALQNMRDSGLDPSSQAARNLQYDLMVAGQIAYNLNGTVVSVKFDLQSWAFWSDARAIAAYLNTLSPDMQTSTLVGIANFRALGGPVDANTPYIVGERGPELFVPSGSGQVIANSDIMNPASGGGSAMGRGGNGNPVYNVNVAVSATADKASIGQTIVEAIRSFEQRSGSGWRS